TLGVETQACVRRVKCACAKTMSVPGETVHSSASNSFQSTSRALLAFLRIYLGVILFITVLGKLTRDTPFATEMLGFLNGVVRRGALPWYTDFIQQVVIPHAALFSYFVMNKIDRKSTRLNS